MDRENFIAAVKELDKSQGNYPLTKKMSTASEREGRINTCPQLLIDLFERLRSVHMRVFVFERLYKKSNMYHFADIFIPSGNVYLVAYNGDEELSEADRKRIFLATCHNYYPFFFDMSKDSLEWTLTKLTNCLDYSFSNPKKGTKEIPVLPAKRKRQRIQRYEKVQSSNKK